MDEYVEKLRKTIVETSGISATPLKGLKVCVNAGNGAGGFFATQVLAPLGADVSSSINLEPDGAFPNHPANPEDKKHVAEQAQRARWLEHRRRLKHVETGSRAPGGEERGRRRRRGRGRSRGRSRCSSWAPGWRATPPRRAAARW